MKQSTVGRIKVWKQNEEGTKVFIMFDKKFNPSKLETSKEVISERDGVIMCVVLDIFKPVERHIEYLEKENERLEKTVDDLIDRVDDMNEQMEDMED